MTLLFIESVCSGFSSQALPLPNSPVSASDLHFAKRVALVVGIVRIKQVLEIG
jgi:hypothetical protein